MTFDQLYTDYQLYVLAIISRRVPAADKDDIAQNVWMTVSQHVEDGSVPEEPKLWLAMLSRHACQDYQRHRERTISLSAPAGEDGEGNVLTVADRIGDVAEGVVDQAVSEEMAEAVEQLSPALQETVTEFYSEGLTIEEIAFRHGTRVGTITMRLSRARDILRSMLTSEEDEKAA